MSRRGRKNWFTVSITGKVTLTVNQALTVVVLVLLGLGTWYQR
ncbi:hypothetical protein [Amycolatopsis sp. WAC 01375]|nr:hypothetical protein [Amycolatopsis sp. WAC 01375]